VSALKPSAGLLAKLGSIAVHTDELLGPSSSVFDTEALRALLDDPELKAWLEAMDAMAMLPLKRTTDKST
jgi:hypothetical protein